MDLRSGDVGLSVGLSVSVGLSLGLSVSLNKYTISGNKFFIKPWMGSIPSVILQNRSDNERLPLSAEVKTKAALSAEVITKAALSAEVITIRFKPVLILVAFVN